MLHIHGNKAVSFTLYTRGLAKPHVGTAPVIVAPDQVNIMYPIKRSLLPIKIRAEKLNLAGFIENQRKSTTFSSC
jgi:hypothetical protein